MNKFIEAQISKFDIKSKSKWFLEWNIYFTNN